MAMRFVALQGLAKSLSKNKGQFTAQRVAKA
jgi:hypothetical protein